MELLLVYSVALLVAVLVSERADRTVLSTAVLFLAVGAAWGLWRGGPVPSGEVRLFAELALVTVLFTDSLNVSFPKLRRAWRLPGRALLLGFPLTLAGNALAAVLLVGLSWPEALLVGAALAPTDPVFASALMTGLLVYSVSRTVHANEFLAVFTAGAAIATSAQRAPGLFAPVGNVASETIKLAAVLVFGSTLSPSFASHMSWSQLWLALAVLFVVRPVALGLALLGSGLPLRERAVAAWFGPKGFASVVYGLYVASAGLHRGELLFHAVATTTALSIVLHSSSDVPVVRWLEVKPGARRSEA